MTSSTPYQVSLANVMWWHVSFVRLSLIFQKTPVCFSFRWRIWGPEESSNPSKAYALRQMCRLTPLFLATTRALALRLPYFSSASPMPELTVCLAPRNHTTNMTDFSSPLCCSHCWLQLVLNGSSLSPHSPGMNLQREAKIAPRQNRLMQLSWCTRSHPCCKFSRR